jgi:SM-20-related protein
MELLDLDAFRASPLRVEPFEHLIVPGFIPPGACGAIHRDYPAIDSPGSFPVEVLTFGPTFDRLLDALRSSAVRAAFEEKFHIDLTGRPTMVTVRGRCGPRDGRIHTDAVTKIITVLVYMNPGWEQAGGQLRLLRSADDLDDLVAEVPPVEGTLLAFRRCDHSYHGHKPFVGPRRVVQLNWVTDRWTAFRELTRHRLSAWVKRFTRRAS